ncbi:MAG: hypothetical protein Q7S22_05955 [Candidatus Micrarchaeota archaeon]|nr:hypothetical protein [Candidatus Micrarchaeota archaeon]
MNTITIEPCASAKAFDIVIKDKKIDIRKAEKIIDKIGRVAAATEVVLLGTLDAKPVTVYASGRVMIKECTRKEADKIGNKLIDALEKGKAIL